MIGALLNQTVTVEPYLGSGSFGPVYGDPVTAPARIEWAPKWVRDSDGNDVLSEATIFVGADFVAAAGSKVTYADDEPLPGNAVVKAYARHYDGAGRVHHIELSV